jgi:GTP cyclohydrolase IIa
MVAVTNGPDVEKHAFVQESIRNHYSVTASMSVAVDPSPAAALGRTSERLQAAGSAQDDDRAEILRGEPLAENERTDGDVQIAHFDVDDATGKYTDRLNEFDAFITIERGYAELMRYMREAHDSLAFFVGGDNVVVRSAVDREGYREAIAHVRESVNVELKVGVGRGRTAQEAGMDAKHALES